MGNRPSSGRPHCLRRGDDAEGRGGGGGIEDEEEETAFVQEGGGLARRISQFRRSRRRGRQMCAKMLTEEQVKDVKVGRGRSVALADEVTR